MLGVLPIDFDSAGVVGDAEESLRDSLVTRHPPEPLAASVRHPRFARWTRVAGGEGAVKRSSSNVSSGLRTLFQKCA